MIFYRVIMTYYVYSDAGLDLQVAHAIKYLNTIQYNTKEMKEFHRSLLFLSYCIILFCIALHCMVLYRIVLYCIALYCIVLLYVSLFRCRQTATATIDARIAAR